MKRLLLLLSTLFAASLSAQTPPTLAPEKLFAARYSKGPAWDATKGPNDQAGMREHSANLGRLRREGHILFGARYGDTGLIVFHAADEAEVRKFLEPDPTHKSGVFRLAVDPFNPFYPGSTNYPTTPEAAILRAYLDAFNRHDSDAVAAFCAEDVKWLSVDGDKVAPETSSRADLQAWLTGYFKSFPTVRSDFLSLEQTGPILSVRERASWENKAGQRVAQQAVGVYEIRDGRIRRVWYFAATREPSAVK